jgi:DNA invertase Pin-like site-specific DNA recombinase
MLVGYARVSTDSQSVETQVAMLKAAGCEKVFTETASGSKTDRPVLSKLIKTLQPNDVLVVVRLDRLARSTRDLLNLLFNFGEHQIGFKSLTEAAIDTTSPSGKLLLAILASISEFEKTLILARTEEGRKRALARGVKFGRKPKLTEFQRQELLGRLAAGESQCELARSYNVSQTTVSFIAKGESLKLN